MANIRDSVVAILNDNGKIVGTGFLARENLILTCAHVVATVGAAIDGDSVRVCFNGQTQVLQAALIEHSWRDVDDGDVAVLRLDSIPQGVAPLRLGNAAGSAGHDFYSYGYATVTDVQGIGARGKIIDIVAGGRLVQLTSQEPDHGMSGAPVWDEKRRVVIGMINKGKTRISDDEDESSRNPFTTFATASDVIFEACKEIEPSDICPYRSLSTFTESDAEFFCGRERIVDKLVESLQRSFKFLAVVGPSGSGKSSVVQAGLMPALRQNCLVGSSKWGLVIVRPASDPYERMVNAGFVNLQDGLVRAVQIWLETHPTSDHLTLVIDQFEELLSSTPDDIRQRFIIELAQLLDTALEVTVVITLRDDFYSRFLNQASLLVGWMERGLVNIPPVLDKYDLRDMVTGPANLLGLTFDEGLVDVIIADACETDQSKGQARSTILPLLEFSLTHLWEQRKDGRLTHEAYKNIGGTTGSLSKWADRSYYELDSSGRKTAEQIFCGLVHLGVEKEQVPDTRRVISIDELANVHKKEQMVGIIDKLVQARLLSVFKGKDNSQQFVEIIHDALLREWGLLAKWIDEYRRHDEIKRERRRRLTIFGLSIGLLVMIFLAGFAIWGWENSNRQTQLALARQLVAQAESLMSARNSKQMQAVLLAVRSMQIMPSSEASQILLNNTAARPILTIQHTKVVTCVAFGQNGYTASASENIIILRNLYSQSEVARMKHDDAVKSLAFSPDGKYLASGGSDRTIRIWDVNTGQEVKRFTQDGAVNTVTFSPDGKFIAGGAEQIINVWKVETGTEVARMKVNTGPISMIVYSKDGQYLVSGDSKNARVWDVKRGDEISRMKHGADVHSVAFGPDGLYVVSGGDDFKVKIWNVKTGDLRAQAEHTGAVTAVAFSPTGNYVVSASRDETARIWDAKTGGEHARMTHDGSVYFASFSPDGRFVVSGGGDKTTRVWSVDYGTEVARMTYRQPVYTAVFSPDGKYILSGDYDKLAQIWEITTTSQISRMHHQDQVYSVSFSPDGKYAISGGKDNLAQVWNVPTGEKLLQIMHDGVVYKTIFSNDGKYVASGGGHDLVIAELASKKEVARIKQDTVINSIALSPNSKYVLSGGEDGITRLWDIATAKELVRLEHSKRVSFVTFSPNGNLAASASYDGTIIIWDIVNNHELTRISHYHEFYHIAFSPDGLYLVSGDINFARIWNVTTGKEISRVALAQFVYSASFSPDGRYVVSAGGMFLKVWNALTGKTIVSLKLDGTINSVAFSPDGKTIVSGDDKTARVWDAFTGREIARLSQGYLVRDVAFNPDGHYIISGGVDGDAQIWPWMPDDLIANTCTSLPRNLTLDEWKQYFGEDEPYQVICKNLLDESIPTATPKPSATP